MRRLLILALLAGCAGPRVAVAPDDAEFAPVEEINAEVTALQGLYSLDCTPAQLTEIGRLAAKTRPPAAPREEVKVGPAYVAALTAVRDALAAFDGDAVSAAYKKLDE